MDTGDNNVNIEKESEPNLESVNKSEELISVLITVFNTEKYVGQCLESVTGQTYRNLEIIVVDDGSTDGSGFVCDDFASRDPRMRVFHTDNRGVSAARNLCLDNAAGAFIIFLDSDDWMESAAIETLHELAVKYGADIAVSTACRDYVDRTTSLLKNKGEIQVFKGEEIKLAHAEKKFGEVVWNKLCRIGCYEGIRFPEGHAYEDLIVVAKIIKTLSERGGTVVKLSEDFIHYRMRKSSITHTTSLNKIVDRWTAYRIKLDLIPESLKLVMPPCIRTTLLMWENYPSFSKEDRKKAMPTVLEMRAFSRENYRRLVKEKYSMKIRFGCFLTQFKAFPVMLAVHLAQKIIRVMKVKKRSQEKMFD